MTDDPNNKVVSMDAIRKKKNPPPGAVLLGESMSEVNYWATDEKNQWTSDYLQCWTHVIRKPDGSIVLYHARQVPWDIFVDRDKTSSWPDTNSDANKLFYKTHELERGCFLLGSLQEDMFDISFKTQVYHWIISFEKMGVDKISAIRLFFEQSRSHYEKCRFHYSAQGLLNSTFLESLFPEDPRIREDIIEAMFYQNPDSVLYGHSPQEQWFKRRLLGWGLFFGGAAFATGLVTMWQW